MNLNKQALKMQEARSKKLILFAFIIFFTFFGQCKEKPVENIITTNFKFEGSFTTNDELVFKLNKTTLRLFSDQPNHIEILTNEGNKIDVTEENHCKMDAVGVSAYQFTNSIDPNLRIILIEDYQDILTGSMYAILIDKNQLIKTFRFCGPQYNYEKYNIKEVLSIKKSENKISFTFDPKKIVTKNKKEQHVFDFAVVATKTNPSIIKKDIKPIKNNLSNQVTIDSLIFDFNNDKINDKVLIRANPKEENVMGNEYFDNINSYFRTLDVFIGKNSNNYTQITNNKNIIPCLRCNEPMNSYSDFKQIGKNSFSVDVISKAENSIYQLVFEWKKDNFYLSQIGVKSFYEETGKTIKLKHFISLNDIKIEDIQKYINQK
ncbi:hypothetical protein [Chryseobacterium arthrosphaerae]|uniref:Uncharacterized protein n=1 Tax=Chryseobacterium arthrosphaerae TaxID=651561 RepID=A0A1B8ZEG8_9FLAO|nr:hypothetical protein [Chryseobacterium arthrosphaerae]OCA70000.1 hypothetical protein BBI00_19230 [Chryseobacterium arthrosphaerae]